MRTDTTTTPAPAPTASEPQVSTCGPTAPPAPASPASSPAPILPPITDIPSATIDRVIDLFACSPHATFAWIADATRLSIESVAAILQSERAQRLIPILRELARQRAELIALDLRCPALYATLNVAQDEIVSTDLKLRASLALLRGVPLRSLAPKPARSGGSLSPNTNPPAAPSPRRTPARTAPALTFPTTEQTAKPAASAPPPPPRAPISEPHASACVPTLPDSQRPSTPLHASSTPGAPAISPARATTYPPRTPPVSPPSPHHPLPSSPHHALTISPLIQQLARARDSPPASGPKDR